MRVTSFPASVGGRESLNEAGNPGDDQNQAMNVHLAAPRSLGLCGAVWSQELMSHPKGGAPCVRQPSTGVPLSVVFSLACQWPPMPW